MPIFAYKAADSAGKVISGTLEAKDQGAAVGQIQGMNCFPIQVVLQGETNGASRLFSDFHLFQRISPKDVMTFTQQLATLLDAGFSLDRSLLVISQFNENGRFSKVIDEVYKDLRQGRSLEESLSQHPRVFNKLYVNMVKAGEVGGVLEMVLDRLSSFLEEIQELKEYIVSAMIYPLLLAGVGGAAVTVLLTFVIPKFAQIFSDMGQAIPLPTQILLSLSEFIVGYWWAMLGAIGLGWYAVKRYLSTETGRLAWDRRQLSLPIWGGLSQKVETARFSRTLGTLMNNGVPLLTSLSIVRDSATNEVIRRAIAEVHRRVKEGERISIPLREEEVFPPLANHMISVGEESGKLEEMLLKMADIYERQVRTTVKRLISMMEPAMILLMALVVGFVVISMLMAIVSINELPM